MAVWAIVPVKPLNRAKSRLAGVLTPAERESLSRDLLVNTLQALASVEEIERTLVISRDSAALHLAREHGAYTVTESGAPDLNMALQRATDVAKSVHANAVIVLTSDLPLLTPDDIKTLIEAAADSARAVVVAPDHHESGTNAILVQPPGLIRYQFGEGSYPVHLEAAREIGADAYTCMRQGFQLDIDVPADLALWREKVEPSSLPT